MDECVDEAPAIQRGSALAAEGTVETAVEEGLRRASPSQIDAAETLLSSIAASLAQAHQGNVLMVSERLVSRLARALESDSVSDERRAVARPKSVRAGSPKTRGR